MPAKRKSKGAYMISAVAEMYEIHPQTLRLYEREGLLKPSRTEGNTRLYTDEDLERLEFILNLARDLGVNIAGIAIILQMRERMEEMNRQMQSFVEYVRTEMLTRFQQAAPGAAGAIVPMRKPTVPRPVVVTRSARAEGAVAGILNPACLRSARIGCLRPDHFHGLHRHGAVGGAGISAGAAGGLCEARSSARIHASAEPAQATARGGAGLEAHLATFFEQDYPRVRNSFLRAGGGRCRSRDCAARGGALSADPGADFSPPASLPTSMPRSAPWN